MKKFVHSLACLCLLVIQVAYAQSPRTVPLPANVAGLFKFSGAPVSMYTGTPQISYPLYEVNTGKIKVPIVISYHASGIKVDQRATWVGLGWALSAGGNF